jgi:hypothetical protein
MLYPSAAGCGRQWPKVPDWQTPLIAKSWQMPLITEAAFSANSQCVENSTSAATISSASRPANLTAVLYQSSRDQPIRSHEPFPVAATTRSTYRGFVSMPPTVIIKVGGHN